MSGGMGQCQKAYQRSGALSIAGRYCSGCSALAKSLLAAVLSGMRKRAARVAIAGLVILLIGPWAYVRLSERERPQVAVAEFSLPSDTARVFVADWGYHTSILVPRPASLRLGPGNGDTARYVEYAWGDRSFYLESNYWPQRLFATVFLPTAAVAYLAGWDRIPRASDGLRALYGRTVTARELRALIIALERSIRRDAAGGRAAPFPPAAGYSGRFYPAAGAYLFWDDCNRWTVERLHEAGLADPGAGVVFSAQVRGRLRGFVRE